MDRCHRIGQQKPVLVLRLATAHSVEGKMLRRANSKLMLEKLVIKKGAFLDVTDVSAYSQLGSQFGRYAKYTAQWLGWLSCVHFGCVLHLLLLWGNLGHRAGLRGEQKSAAYWLCRHASLPTLGGKKETS